MDKQIVISIDAMGGDFAPRSVLEGVAIAAKKHKDLFFFLFGNEEVLTPIIKEVGLPETRYKIHHTTHVIKGTDKPSHAIRTGRESSMWQAIMAVRNGYAKAVVSAGNTGALMAMSKICLGMIPGIDRPAIAAILPSETGPITCLDLGANTECDAQNLVEFAIMGDVLHKVLFGDEHPKVGLLNIGSEETKGREEIRDAATQLKEYGEHLNFVGFVEGNDIAAGKAQVYVSDGFSGNIALKTLEGTAKFFAHTLKKGMKRSPFGILGFLIAAPALKKLKKKLDPRQYNGAMLVGLNGISVKSHGGADAFSFACAIDSAARMAKNDLCEKIKTEMTAFMNLSGLNDTAAP
ncbi:MAG: phosphate acyltransferase PlsX [Alphaproteobacteria bacterium]|nr:phosphate acyltransferase PlsX [Alphaproteobacteria bacterium]